MEKRNFAIVEFDPADRVQMDLMCSIHTSVLPESFVVGMGRVFMTRFYYSILPRMGFMKCFLARYDGNYVGMIVTNRKPFSLIRSSIPKNFFRFALVMATAVVTDLRRLRVLWELWTYKPDPLLKKFEDSGTAFEILTIGVLEQYRQTVLPSGEKISHALLRHAVSDYRSRGYTTITGQIIKSNKSALGFYSKYQAKFIQSGVREQGVILDLPINNIFGDN